MVGGGGMSVQCYSGKLCFKTRVMHLALHAGRPIIISLVKDSHQSNSAKRSFHFHLQERASDKNWKVVLPLITPKSSPKYGQQCFHKSRDCL